MMAEVMSSLLIMPSLVTGVWFGINHYSLNG